MADSTPTIHQKRAAAQSRAPRTGKFMRGIQQMEKDRRAAELRGASLTYAQIAAEMGYADQSGAYLAVQRGLAMVPTERISELRQEELLKLDRRERFLIRVMSQEHMMVSHGHVVMHKGQPVINYGPSIAACNGLGRVQRRRAALLGLDAPAQRIVEVITQEAVDAEIRRLETMMAELPD